MKTIVSAWMTLLLASSMALAAQSGSLGRERTLWDFGWQFHRGEAAGAEKPEFAADHWRTVDLPHDWSVERVPSSRSLFDPQVPQRQRRGLPARRDQLVPQDVHAAGRRAGPVGVRRVRRGLHGLRRLAQRPAPGQSSLRLHFVRVRFDAASEMGRAQRLGGAGERAAALLAVVLRGRHLPARVADHNQPRALAQWGVYITTPKISDQQATVRVRRAASEQSGKNDTELRIRVIDAARKR